MITRAPSFAKPSAIPLPIPVPPPVTIVRIPARDMVFLLTTVVVDVEVAVGIAVVETVVAESSFGCRVEVVVSEEIKNNAQWQLQNKAPLTHCRSLDQEATSIFSRAPLWLKLFVGCLSNK